MSKYTGGGAVSQVQRMRRAVVGQKDLCLGKLLEPEEVRAAIGRHQGPYRCRFWTPLLTLWTFLYQVLSVDGCCRRAVARVLATGGTGDGPTPGDRTGGYCKARGRLAEPLLAELARGSGRRLSERAGRCELLGGRVIKIADGTTVSGPDTAANQRAYPQPQSQKPGLGFPLMRLVGVISLGCGALLDVAIGPYAGKRTGETALLGQLLGGLDGGDVLLGDAIFSNYWTFAMVLERGADLVTRHDGKRKINWREGEHLGRHDHVVSWQRPQRPRWMSPEQYERMAGRLRIRELEVKVRRRGFRTRRLIVVSSLIDAERYPAGELAEVYRARWQAELDLRSIKVAMGMDVLRCKSPEMMRKEIWMHLLGYNLVRGLMVEAAEQAGCAPRQISFAGAMQTLEEHAARVRGRALTAERYQQILGAVAAHRVGDRPGRVQPRATKRRPKKIAWLNEPRPDAIARLLKTT